jgi:hypothetical protein
MIDFKGIKALGQVTTLDLRKFGFTIGAVAVGLALFSLLQDRAWWWIPATISAPFLGCGLICPRTLKWVYVVWMGLALVVGGVVATIFLVLLFYLVVTPVGWVARAAGKDFLRRKIEARAGTYWIARPRSERKSARRYEQQF